MNETATLTTNERGVVISGIAAAILSFLPWYLEFTFEGTGFDMSTSAWTGMATMGMVMLLGSTALIAIKAMSAGTLPVVARNVAAPNSSRRARSRATRSVHRGA